MQSQFIRVHDKYIRLDAIGYIDCLESGRSMVFITGLNQEKQMISVDVEETRRLRAFMETQMAPGCEAPQENATSNRYTFARSR